jgi:hypothetical protein
MKSFSITCSAEIARKICANYELLNVMFAMEIVMEIEMQSLTKDWNSCVQRDTVCETITVSCEADLNCGLFGRYD